MLFCSWLDMIDFSYFSDAGLKQVIETETYLRVHLRKLMSSL